MPVNEPPLKIITWLIPAIYDFCDETLQRHGCRDNAGMTRDVISSSNLQMAPHHREDRGCGAGWTSGSAEQIEEV